MKDEKDIIGTSVKWTLGLIFITLVAFFIFAKTQNMIGLKTNLKMTIEEKR